MKVFVPFFFSVSSFIFKSGFVAVAILDKSFTLKFQNTRKRKIPRVVCNFDKNTRTLAEQDNGNYSIETFFFFFSFSLENVLEK